MADTVAVERDPFLDEEFGQLDTRPDAGEALPFQQELAKLAEENPELVPDLQTEEPPTPVAPVPAAQPETPETYSIDGGGSYTIEHTRKGWKGTLDIGDGANPQVFYGPTKDDLMRSMATALIHANRKIRSQSRELKLGKPTTTPATKSVESVAPNPRDLTADEKFEIKTQLQSDPDLALQDWFQKKTGLTLEQLLQVVREGQAAKNELSAEAVARGFIGNCPGYFPDQSGHNMRALVSYVFKNVANESVPTDRDPIGVLLSKGLWTVENLTQAYEDLNEAGLLVQRPAVVETKTEEPAEEPTPAPVPAAPAAPAPNSERIARTVKRPRAGLGLGRNEASSAATIPEAKPPSDEELDSMSDADIEKLMSDVRRARAQTRR